MLNQAWWFFTLLPSKQAKQDKENAKLKREVVKLKRELNAVSAQDDFAKWARLRRQHDKAKEKYEKECAIPMNFLPEWHKAY